MRVAGAVREAVVPAMIGDPSDERALKRHRTQHRERELERAQRFETSMREEPMETDGDAMADHGEEDRHEGDVEPRDGVPERAADDKNGNDERAQGHDAGEQHSVERGLGREELSGRCRVFELSAVSASLEYWRIHRTSLVFAHTAEVWSSDVATRARGARPRSITCGAASKLDAGAPTRALSADSVRRTGCLFLADQGASDGERHHSRLSNSSQGQMSGREEPTSSSRLRCLGWLVEHDAGSGACSLGTGCDALALLDNYPAYRAAHPRLRAPWLAENYDES